MRGWRIRWFSSGMFGLDSGGFSSPVGYSGFFLVELEFGGIVLSVYLGCGGMIVCLMVGGILPSWKVL